jgi:hypothetical protein
VPEEERALFERLSGGQSRNLADLITAKLAAHENRVQFKNPVEPREPGFPPKVVEVYKKHSLAWPTFANEVGLAYYSLDTSLANSPKPSKSFLRLRIGRRF